MKRQEQTKEFWALIDDYELYVSDINIKEMNAITDNEIKNKLISLIESGIKIEVNDEVKELAGIYVREGIIPQKYESDAIHLALTAVNSIDILISWNFKHLVKRKTRIEVNLINSREGYRTIEIIAPPEL
ncbi:MAG: PIN domain nuclease [Candidatus Helarchaeota archaeon]